MGDPALITVADNDRQRHYRCEHGDPLLLIPRLAGFIAWADTLAVPLTTLVYEAHTAWLDSQQPPIPGPSSATAPRHRYRLTLCEPGRVFDLTVHDRADRPDRAGSQAWLLAEHLSTRADLHTAAARMCRLMARAGGPHAAAWHESAELFHRLRHNAPASPAQERHVR